MDVLKNKYYETYNRLSRYGTFPSYYHTLDNKYVTSIDRYLNNDTEYILHLVKQRDTFDSLALKYYNNPTYFWAICSFNHIQDPFEDLVPGSYIKIPVLNDISYESY